jgi:hypothetical protein
MLTRGVIICVFFFVLVMPAFVFQMRTTVSPTPSEGSSRDTSRSPSVASQRSASPAESVEEKHVSAPPSQGGADGKGGDWRLHNRPESVTNARILLGPEGLLPGTLTTDNNAVNSFLRMAITRFLPEAQRDAAHLKFRVDVQNGRLVLSGFAGFDSAQDVFDAIGGKPVLTAMTDGSALVAVLVALGMLLNAYQSALVCMCVFPSHRATVSSVPH